MKVLVLGGTGIIGTGIVQAACRAGYDVHSVSRKLREVQDETYPVNYIKADWYNDDEALKIADLDADVVVDCLVYTDRQLSRDLELWRHKCRHFIYISTAGVYDRPASGIREEDAPRDPERLRWSYSVNKRKAELWLEEHQKDYPCMITTIRPPVTYGNTRIPCAMVSRQNQWTLIDRIIQGRPVVFTRDDSLHNLTHIRILSDAAVALFLNPEADRKTFHITDDQACSWDDVVRAVGKLLGVKPKIVHVPVEMLKWIDHSLYEEIKYNKMHTVVFDNTAVKTVAPDVDYHVPLEIGLKTTLEYLEKVESKKTLDKRFDTVCDILLMKCRKNLLPEEERAVAEEFRNKQTIREKIYYDFKKREFILRRLVRIMINKAKGRR